jgi:hypothetical protein
MPTPDQTAGTRPISFLLMGGPEEREVDLVIRPEELTKTDPSRTTVHQTLGGAWADSFGQGLSQIQIAGTTGWGQGIRPDGSGMFQLLFDGVFKEWHRQRAEIVAGGGDPNVVQLIFTDGLDQYTQVVIPMQFTLKRSRSRPLLFMYMVNMVSIASDISEIPPMIGYDYVAAVDELGDFIVQLQMINQWLMAIGGAVIGPALGGIIGYMALGGAVLGAFGNLVGAGLGALNGALPATLTVPFAVFTGALSQAISNTMGNLRVVLQLPQTADYMLGRAQRGYQNVATIIANSFQGATTIPNYSALYSAAGGSSALGGAPVSIYTTTNPFAEMFPSETNGVQYTAAAAQSIHLLSTSDIVLTPMGLAELMQHMQIITEGVVL